MFRPQPSAAQIATTSPRPSAAVDLGGTLLS
jgi:hypothetical protein